MEKNMLLELKDTLINLENECINQINLRQELLSSDAITTLISEAEQLIVLNDFKKESKEKIDEKAQELKDLKKKWN